MDRYTVPEGERAHDCPYCDRPFADRRLLSLHLGVDHADRLTDGERADFEDAYGEENDALRRHRIAAIGLLSVLYFGLLIVYALV